mgnify:FL=1
MAVPQIRRAWAFGSARAVRLSLVLDLVVGLLIVLGLPLASVTIPNTVSVVAELLPPDVSKVDMTRAHGMALPALVLTVPLALLAARRLRAAPMLLAGLALLAAATAAGGYAGSAAAVGALRALQGVGGGLVLCGTLLAARERHGRAGRVLLSLWAGMLAASLLTAQALALWPLDQATSWRVTLQPYPVVTGLALAVGAVHLVLWRRAGEAVTRPVAAGGRPLAATAPAVGIAALALGITFDWPSVLTIAAAAVATLVVFALALLGAPDGAGRTLALTMAVTGLLVLPTAAQTTYVELRGVGGPGLIGLWPPFAIAAVAALAVPVLADRLARRAAASAAPEIGTGGPGAQAVRIGLAVLVAGLAATRLLVPDRDGLVLVVPFTLIAAGAAVALAAALRAAATEAALFGLTLCTSGVLAGFLLGTGMQIARVRAVERIPGFDAQDLVDGFVATLHTWALVAGFAVVAALVLTAIPLRRRVAGRAVDAAADPYDPAQPTTVMDVVVARGDGLHGARPVVPPPSPSPEAGPGPVGGGERPEPPRGGFPGEPGGRRGRDGDEWRPDERGG